MHFHIEPVAAIGRLYGDGSDIDNHDPYEWAATIRYLRRDTIEVCGVDKQLTIAGWRAIVRYCEDPGNGIRYVVIRRHGRVKRYEARWAREN